MGILGEIFKEKLDDTDEEVSEFAVSTVYAVTLIVPVLADWTNERPSISFAVIPERV